MSIRQFYLVRDQTAPGASTIKRWDMPSNTYTIECFFETDPGVAVTALTIALQGSVTNLNYATLASHSFTATDLLAKFSIFHVVDKPIKTIRSNVTTLTSTGVGDVRVTVVILSTDR
jgi:hypothetical protein